MNTIPIVAPEDVRLRRRDVLRLSGITECELDKLVRCGLLTPIRVRDNSKAWFSRKQVVAVFQLDDARSVRPG